MEKNGSFKSAKISSKSSTSDLKVHNVAATRSESTSQREDPNVKFSAAGQGFSQTTNNINKPTTLFDQESSLLSSVNKSGFNVSSPDLSYSRSVAGDSAYHSSIHPTRFSPIMLSPVTQFRALDEGQPESVRSGDHSPPVRDCEGRKLSAFRPVALPATSSPLYRQTKDFRSTDCVLSSTFVHPDSLFLENIRLKKELQVVNEESKELLQTNSDLTCDVQTLKTRLEGSVPNEYDVDRFEEIRKELDQSYRSRFEIEKEVSNFKTDLERKNEEAAIQANDLCVQKETQTQLRQELKSLKEAISGKEEIILSLKSKIANIYTDLNNEKSMKESFEYSSNKLSIEVENLLKSRQWYQKQLQSSQEIRNRLQIDISHLQDLINEGSNLNELLNHENNTLKLKLSKTHRAMLEDKQSLAKELEDVRNDMIEREAMFEQLLSEKNNLEELLNAKRVESDDANIRFQIYQTKIENLEDDISSLKLSLQYKTDELESLECAKMEMTKKVSFMQDSIDQKDGIVSEQCRKYNEVADKVRKLEDENQAKSELVDLLNREKSTLELNLTSLSREKDALDKYMENLKVDMVKVEENFQRLRADLEFTTTELHNIQIVRDDLSLEVSALKKSLNEKEEAIKVLKSEQENVAKDFRLLYEENSKLQSDIEDYKNLLEKTELKVALLEESSTQLANENSELRCQLEVSHEEISSLKEDLREQRLEVEKLTTEHKKYIILLDNFKELSTKYEALSTENEKLNELFLRETTRLEKELKETKENSDLTVASKEREISEAKENLQILLNEKTLLQEKIASITLDHKKMLDAKMNEFKLKLGSVSCDVARLKEDKQACLQLAQDVQSHVADIKREYQGKLFVCFQRMGELQEKIHFYEDVENSNKSLLIELEKYRGEILGLRQSLSNVKDHASDVESNLAQQEAAFIELEKTSATKLQDVLFERDKLVSRLASLELQLDESLTNCDSYKQISQEIQTKYAESQHQVNVLLNESSKFELELEETKNNANYFKSKSETLETELTADKENNTKMKKINEELEAQIITIKNQISDIQEQESAKSADFEHLSKLLESKSSEVDSLKYRLENLSEKQTGEISELQNLSKIANDEVISIRTEINSVKQEKLDYQRQLAHLRGSLRSALQRYRMFSAESEENPCSIDAVHLEMLLQDCQKPLPESRASRGLTRCLDRLNAEVATLQEKMTDHTQFIHSSVYSWKKLKDQALMLQQLCDNGANPEKDESVRIAIE